MASKLLDVTYGLTTSYCKAVSCAIEVAENVTPYVWISKPGTSYKIKLSQSEFKTLVDCEAVISNFFFKSAPISKDRYITLTSGLRVRFDQTYSNKMLVIERYDHPSSPGFDTTDNVVSIWIVEKTWFNLVRLFPLIIYLTNKQLTWCDEIKDLFNKLTKEIKENHADALNNVEHINDFIKILDNLDLGNFLYASGNDLDVLRCLYEIIKFSAENLLIMCRR